VLANISVVAAAADVPRNLLRDNLLLLLMSDTFPSEREI
jgi:hypothetical protein